MKMIEIRKKDVTSLISLLKQTHEELRKFRFGGAGSRKRDVKEGRTLRRQIARIETEISARRLAVEAK